MADQLTETIAPLVELFEQIEEMGVIAQVGASLGLTLFGLLFTRYVLLRIAWRIVRRTEAEWDNDVLDPIAPFWINFIALKIPDSLLLTSKKLCHVDLVLIGHYLG